MLNEGANELYLQIIRERVADMQWQVLSSMILHSVPLVTVLLFVPCTSMFFLCRLERTTTNGGR